MSAAVQGMTDDPRGIHSGWIAGGLLILAIFAAGAAFWFRYHP